MGILYKLVFVNNVVLTLLQSALLLVLLLDFTQVEVLAYLVILLQQLVLLHVLLKDFTHLEILAQNVLSVLWLVLQQFSALLVHQVTTWHQELCVLYVHKANPLVH